MYTKPSSPLPIGAVLDSGFSLYRHALKETFLFGFLAALLSAPVSRYMQTAAMSAEPNVATSLVATLLVMAIAILLYTPIIAKIDAIQHGRYLSAAEALAIGVRRFLVILAVGVIFVFAISIGFVLFVVPGVFLMVSLAFAFIAAIVESKGVVDSLKYSFALVRGRWWRTAVLLTIISIVLLVLYALFYLLAGLFAFRAEGALEPGQLMPWYVDFILNPLMAGFVGPLSYALFMAVYDDLKLRHEGGDIAERIAAAEA